jgi:hypothetical protein
MIYGELLNFFTNLWRTPDRQKDLTQYSLYGIIEVLKLIVASVLLFHNLRSVAWFLTLEISRTNPSLPIW